MARKPGSFAVHTALLFDPKQKAWLRNVSIEVNPTIGAIARVVTRSSPDLPSPLPPQDIDLRNEVVLPGFVDSHTHIFLHAYA
jgi:imidazolonepropionase-like amidohydrolase